MTKLGLSIVQIALGLSLLGCATDEASGPELLPGWKLPAKPANGMQIVTPIVHGIAAGSDNEICTWTDAYTDRDVDIKSVEGFQPEPGHHVVVFYTTLNQPAGTQRPCLDADMASFRQVAAVADQVTTEVPGDLVYRIPKGSQIVLNHHYLNATERVVDGQAAINLYFADPGRTYTASSGLAILDSTFDLGAGIQELDVSCTMNRDLRLWSLIPHMHRWGKNIKIDIVKGSVPTRMFDTNWDAQYTFHPPEKRMDPAAPLVFAKGDQVKIHCTWNNDTGNNLTFGFEMCLFFGQFVDDQSIGGWTCNKGEWSPL